MPKKYKVNKYDAGKIEEIKPKIKMSDMFEGVKDNKKKKPKPKTKKKNLNINIWIKYQY